MIGKVELENAGNAQNGTFSMTGFMTGWQVNRLSNG